MGVLSNILGLGPLALSALVIAILASVFLLPMAAPIMPFIAITLSCVALGMVVWRRGYASAIGFLTRGVKPTSFWSAICPDLRLMKLVTTKRTLANIYPMAGKVALFEDRNGERGYAVKVLKLADIQRTFETTTEHERQLLLDRMAKAIEGLGGVEVKLVIERSPEGEKCYMILYSEIKDGDEKSAVYSVEHAAKTLMKSMEHLGVILLDDLSYLEPAVSKSRTNKPLKMHGVLLSITSLATLMSSALCLDLGPLAASMLLSGFIGFVISLKLLRDSTRAGCSKCANGDGHVHFHIGGWEAEVIAVKDSGTIMQANGSEIIYSKYLAIVNNQNRDLSYNDIKGRLEVFLKAFSNMLYTLEDFRIAIHVKPQSPGDVVKVALAKADFYGMDAQVGGAVSGYFKAGKSMNLADRIMHGERPYLFSGVIEVRARTDGRRSERMIRDYLNKQLREASSYLDTMNLYTKELSDGWGAAVAKRFMFLPPPPRGSFESNPVPFLKALTRDFIAISPIAFKRRPVMPKDGVYLGRDGMGRRVYWNPETLPNPHILILGPPGGGKSTLVKTMLFRIHQLVEYSGTGRPPSVLIIDPAGEYADKAELLRELGLKVTVIDLIEKKYNPLLLAGMEPRQRASRFIDFILGNIMPLDRFQAGILYEGIMLAYNKVGGIDEYKPETWSDDRASKVTIRHIYEYIRWRAAETAKRVREKGGTPELDPATVLLSDLARVLTPMAEGACALNKTDITVEDLVKMGGVVIISFKTETKSGTVRMSDTLQKLIVWSILEHVKDYMTSLKAEEGVKLIVVIDEGHKFLKGLKEDVPLGQHLREGRKFGASYVIITHLPEDIPPELPNLVGTTFIFGFGNPTEAARVAEMLNLTEEEYERLMGLKRGELYVKWINDPRPLFFVSDPDKRALVKDAGDKRWLLYRMQ